MTHQSSGKGRRPSLDELELWRLAMMGTKPLKPAPAVGSLPDAGPLIPPPAPAAPRPPSYPSVAPQPARRRHESELAPGVAAGIDRRTLVRLRRGLITPETQIDLHHCTQEEAFSRLAGFLAASQQSGRRCVLVITGKGHGSGGREGVLKAAAPRWLNEPGNRPRVLAFTHATAAYGGEGALFVLLRRQRP